MRRILYLRKIKPRRFHLCLFCLRFSLKHTRYVTTPLPCSSWVAPGIQTAPTGGRFPLLHQPDSPPFFSPKAMLPTYLPNLTYLPATLFTINYTTCFSIFSHSYIYFLHAVCLPPSLEQLFLFFFETLYSTFSPSSMLCVLLFCFSSFPHTFPSTPFIVFIFLRISHAGCLTQ